MFLFHGIHCGVCYTRLSFVSHSPTITHTYSLSHGFVQPDSGPVVRLLRFRGGNAAHRAPEVAAQLGRLGHAVPDGGVMVDFRGQAVYELGVLLWEMAVGWHPVLVPPALAPYTSTDVCVLAPDVFADLEGEGYPTAEFAGLVGRMVAFETGDRPSLAAAEGRFEVLFDPKLAAAHAAIVRHILFHCVHVSIVVLTHLCGCRRL